MFKGAAAAPARAAALRAARAAAAPAAAAAVDWRCAVPRPDPGDHSPRPMRPSAAPPFPFSTLTVSTAGYQQTERDGFWLGNGLRGADATRPRQVTFCDPRLQGSTGVGVGFGVGVGVGVYRCRRRCRCLQVSQVSTGVLVEQIEWRARRDSARLGPALYTRPQRSTLYLPTASPQRTPRCNPCGMYLLQQL